MVQYISKDTVIFAHINILKLELTIKDWKDLKERFSELCNSFIYFKVKACTTKGTMFFT